MANALRDQLQRCVESGEWWEPADRPRIPADWIRELVVAGTWSTKDVAVRPVGVRIRRAIVDGCLDFEDADLAVPLLLDDVQMRDPVILTRAVGRWVAITNSVVGGVSGARLALDHSLVLDGSRTDAPILLDNANIGGDLSFDGGFTAAGVRLVGATIGGSVHCAGATLELKGGAALDATRSKIAGGVYLNQGFAAKGALRFDAATIEASVHMEGATVSNYFGMSSYRSGEAPYSVGPVVSAVGAKVGGSAYLNRLSAKGYVLMTGAVIGGDLECSGSSFLFLEDFGRAFIADRAEIGGNVLLNDGFTAEGDVSLAQSTIGGTLDCRNARLQIVQQMPIDGLNLADAAVRGAFVWRPQDLQWSRIDLTRCSVGLLDDDIDCWPVTGGLFLNGFTYGRLGGNLDVKRRVAWVQLTSGFHSQPYDQLASTYRAMHRPSEAREVLIAKEKARNDTLSAWRRRAHALWGLSTAYGYKPSRAVWIFTVALVLAGFLFWWAGDSGAMEPTDPNTTATADSCTGGQQYPCYQPFVYAADVMIPVVDLGQTEAWTPNSSLQGELEDPWAISGIWTSVIEGLGGVLGWALALALAAALIHRFRS